MSAITKEQFLRGIEAIKTYDAFARKISRLYHDAGLDRVDSVGGEQIEGELQRQLEERCNDRPDQYGSLIAYMLYDCGGPITQPDGRTFMVNTPELLWGYWCDMGEGPFASPPEDGSQSPVTRDGEATKRAALGRPNPDQSTIQHQGEEP